MKLLFYKRGVKVVIDEAWSLWSLYHQNAEINADGKLLPWEFPDWKQVLPDSKPPKTWVKVYKHDLMGLLSQALVSGKEDPAYRGVAFGIDDGRLVATKSTPGMLWEDSIPIVEREGQLSPQERTGVNPKYLFDGLLGIESDYLTLNFADTKGLAPIWVKEDGLLVIVSPMRL
jgi:DNA polymerase III sliding clamp (beta) subunit (PCNA family)